MKLEQLLDAGAGFHAEFGNGMSNHLPMALIALHRLGATEERMAAFASHYATRLAPAPPAATWPSDDNWLQRLGDHNAWPAYRSLFAQWLASEGSTAVLAQVLPELMRGCGAVAFHGLIRTAYAVHAGLARELADALAYWTSYHFPLGDAACGEENDPLPLLAELTTTLAGHTSTHNMIDARMRDAALAPGFAAIVARLRGDQETLPTLARHAAQLYAASGNFTVLHLVTSAHAMRVLLPFVREPLQAVSCYWRAFAAGVAAGAMRVVPAIEVRDWDGLLAAALLSNNDHLIKLVDSCREQESVYGGDVWRLAASRAVAQERG